MYKRVLLKLSGEALAGNEKNFDPVVLRQLAAEIKEVHDAGVQVAIVVGGGNFIRGKSLQEMGADRVTGDSMGMLATIINALAIQTYLEGIDVDKGSGTVHSEKSCAASGKGQSRDLRRRYGKSVLLYGYNGCTESV